MHRIGFVGALLLALSSVAQAGLAPSKASQFVNLTSGATCTCAGGNGVLMDTVVRPDGSTAPFAIPAKQVLVLDGWSWLKLAPSAVDTVFFCLGASASAVSWVSTASSVAGQVFHESSLPPITVKSGVPICVASYGPLPTGTHMHGFLAADK